MGFEWERQQAQGADNRGVNASTQIREQWLNQTRKFNSRHKTIGNLERLRSRRLTQDATQFRRKAAWSTTVNNEHSCARVGLT